MESINGHSAACCNIPPVVSQGYQVKGRYETIGGLKTYVTGPASAQKALLVIYDIFGFFPQTLQGADILATSDKEHEYQVFMPDLFDGEPADLSWYPPDTEEKKTALSGWIKTRMPQAIGVPRIPQILSSIEAAYGGKVWGAVGFCWGGKLVSLTSGANTPFKASVQAHPGMIDAADARAITIPVCMLASKDEDVEEVRRWDEALVVKEKRVEVFGDQVHGWMSARAKLGEVKAREGYERGYRIFLEFFGRYL